MQKQAIKVDDRSDGETTTPRPLLVVARAGAADVPNLVEEVAKGIYKIGLLVGTFTSIPLDTAHATCPTCDVYKIDGFYTMLKNRQIQDPYPLEAFRINERVAPEETLAALACAAKRLLADKNAPEITCVACVDAPLVTSVTPSSGTSARSALSRF